MFVLEHIEEEDFWNSLVNFLIIQFGSPRISSEEYLAKQKQGKLTDDDKQDWNSPPPMSVGQYVEKLLQDNFWGDHFTLSCWARMFMVRLVFHLNILSYNLILFICMLSAKFCCIFPEYQS